MPDSSQDDPVVRSGRREAFVACLIFLGAMIYTVGYCTLYGYGGSTSELQFALGIPRWVLLGIVLPWMVCLVLSWWFAYRFMTDEPIECERQSVSRDGKTGESWLDAE